MVLMRSFRYMYSVWHCLVLLSFMGRFVTKLFPVDLTMMLTCRMNNAEGLLGPYVSSRLKESIYIYMNKNQIIYW